MISALEKEIVWAHQNNPFYLETLYFGGGTPSILTNDELAKLIKTVNDKFGKTYIECTLESNPDDITVDKVAMWKQLGINRISIGLQSFKEQDLLWMNRAHNKEQSYSCVQTVIDGGIQNITVDLMYGLPGLTDEEWRSHVQTVAKMGVQHVSAYCLTIEERTALAKKVATDEIIPLDEEQQARQFEILIQELSDFGFEQYEISNFSIPGYESKHNSAYWKGKKYIGIGPSAHSFFGETRSWNIANNTQYMKGVEEGNKWYEEETLSSVDQFNELILTSLRMVEGLNVDTLSTILDPDDAFWNSVSDFGKEDLLFVNDNRVILTPKGRLQADHIASELFRSQII